MLHAGSRTSRSIRTRLAAGFTRRKVSRSTRTLSPSFPFLTCTAMDSCSSPVLLSIESESFPSFKLRFGQLNPTGLRVYAQRLTPVRFVRSSAPPPGFSGLILSLFPRPSKYEKPTSRPATPFLASPTWPYIPSFRRVLVLCTVFQRSSTCTLRRTPLRIGR